MPIPAMTAAGLLPPGVYDATLAEVQQAFGTRTQRRVDLFQKLTQFMNVARSFALFPALVTDGSFLSDKDDPGDIDAVLLLARGDLGRLLAHPNHLQVLDQSAVKAQYEIHLFLDPLPSGVWTNFFQGLKPEDALARNFPQQPGAAY